MTMATWKPGQVITDALLNTRDLKGQIVFVAARAAVQAIANSTLVDISWDTPTIDTLGAYSGGSPTRFTPTTAGYYYVSGLGSYASNATNDRTVAVAKNGTTVVATRIRSAATAATRVPITPYPVYMNGTTDYLTIQLVQDSGGSLNTDTGIGQPYVVITYGGA